MNEPLWPMDMSTRACDLGWDWWCNGNSGVVEEVGLEELFETKSKCAGLRQLREMTKCFPL